MRAQLLRATFAQGPPFLAGFLLVACRMPFMMGPGRLVVISVGVAAIVGIAAGIGAFTFGYAKGASYLGSDPRACANCHVMQSHFDAWQRSSHRAVAVCNDCHAPTHLLPKYWVKARNGFHHSVAFTSGDFHEPIAIGRPNRAVTEAQCRSCHAPIVESIDHAGQELSCIRCHRDVGHSL